MLGCAPNQGLWNILGVLCQEDFLNSEQAVPLVEGILEVSTLKTVLRELRDTPSQIQPIEMDCSRLGSIQHCWDH